MHPILFSIGSFQIGTYGLLIVIAFFSARFLAMRHGKADGLAPEAISDLAFTLLLSGLLGSRLLMLAVDLSNGMPISDIFTLSYLRAAGAVHGGILLSLAAFFWRVHTLKLPMARTMDVLAPAIPLGQAIGRLGCLMAGCCWGSECHLPWAIHFSAPEAMGAPLGISLHPVQLYNTLAGGLICLILLILRKHRSFPAQLLAAYFILEGTSRTLLEGFRGDLDRGTGLLGWEWLSTGRCTGMIFVILGGGLWVWLSRRHHQKKVDA